MTMKRKDVDEVSDDFSDFSLSSPARKIRRLDGELAPIAEEIDDAAAMSSISDNAVDEAAMSSIIGSANAEEMVEEKRQLRIQELLPTSTTTTTTASTCTSSTYPIVEHIDIDNANQERAMVLFKPVNAQILQHHSAYSNFSVSLPPQLISGFKNHFLWSSSNTNSAQEEASNDCMAVVPWVGPQQQPFTQPQVQIESSPPELMDIEDSNTNSMDQHDDTNTAVYFGFGGTRPSNGLPRSQWQQQQQHCMIPHLQHNSRTPIIWFQ